MFPGAHDQVYRNEAGEPIGWDSPPEPSDFYCDQCGYCHAGPCEDDDE